MKPVDEMTIVITGATDGIGFGTARTLAQKGARLLIHGRDEVKLEHAHGALYGLTGDLDIETYRYDFADLDQVRAFAADIAERHDRIDVLINNAGIGTTTPGTEGRELSAQGHELRFAVNHLAPFALQLLLRPLLETAALDDSDDEHAGASRIVNIASAGQAEIEFDDVMLAHDYSGHRAYCQSKLAMIMTTIEFAARLDPKVLTVNALHPGSLLDTKMVREGWNRVLGPVEDGIESELFLATSPDIEGVSGEYFDRMSRARALPQAYDAAARKRLWDLSCELTGVAG